MTLYDAWSRGHKWVVVRGYLCKISLPPAFGFRRGDTFWVAHLGNWRHPRCRFRGNLPMAEPCEVVNPNSREFRTRQKA